MTGSGMSPKASDIDDADFIRRVDRLQLDGTRGDHWPDGRRWVAIWDMEPEYPDMPPKVVAAKFRQLNKRGLIDGCTCGCRGDLQVTEAGLALIAPAPAT